jgi:hypothetical protein
MKTNLFSQPLLQTIFIGVYPFFFQMLFGDIEGSLNLRFSLDISRFLPISKRMGNNRGESGYNLDGEKGQAILLT